MDSIRHRVLVNQLAEDLGWLEEHSRRQGEKALQAGQLRLAGALVRNCIGPFLDGQPALPLHIAVVGGAGAGKSTVANLLCGTSAAETNPQAGYTRHPIAYTGTNGAVGWSGHVGFLGKLQLLTEPCPANLDADVYQVRHLSANGSGFSLLNNFVVWDCPDMTTLAASEYIPRLLEVAGLADVIVYVASDERYNDEVPTQYLHLLLQTGKPIVVCLVKMKETDAPALIAHFRQEVLGHVAAGNVACVAIPFLSPDQLRDPVGQASQYRIPLLNQIAVYGEPPEAARSRAVSWAVHYLASAQEKLMGVARGDLTALQNWRRVVQTGKEEFEHRYKYEFLTSEKFRRFDEALVRLIDLLELPGAGKLVSGALYVLRTPYRLIKGFLSKTLSRPEVRTMPEQPMLEEAFSGWLDLLRKEAARHGDDHAVWSHIEKGFAGGLTDQARERFHQGFRGFQLAQADEVDRTARAIYEELEKNPAVLNTLRGGKLAMDVGAIVAAVAVGGVLNWHDLIYIPLAASITQQLVELLGKQYVDGQREYARNRQMSLVTQFISGPMAEWLTQWPASGGSAYERLQQVLQRIPSGLVQLEGAVREKVEADRELKIVN